MESEPDLQALLRLEVGRFRQAERRRRFEVTVHVGMQGGNRESLVLSNQLVECDRQLRVELLLSILEGTSGETAWLTRPGVTEIHDQDLEWLAAAISAFGVADRSLQGFYAITHEGWLDVRTGDRRVWKRLRL